VVSGCGTWSANPSMFSEWQHSRFWEDLHAGILRMARISRTMSPTWGGFFADVGARNRVGRNYSRG
jgi:hypothetical protein